MHFLFSKGHATGGAFGWGTAPEGRGFDSR
jgi:hypothetical protein